jgi:hypothetical protein
VERLSRHFGSHAHLFATPENIERATRLNRVAPGIMGQVGRYAEALAGIRETHAGIARDEARLAAMETRGEGNSEAAVALRADIARRREEALRRREQADKEMDEAVKATPETSTGPNGQIIRPRQDGQALVDSIGNADAAAKAEAEAQAREAERLRLEAERRATREAAAAKAAAEARAREEAAAKVAALMGEDAPTKSPTTGVQESAAKKDTAVQAGPATKAPAVQEGPLAKQVPPVKQASLTAGPGQ